MCRTSTQGNQNDSVNTRLIGATD